MNPSLQVVLRLLAAARAPVPFVGLPRPGVAVRCLNCMALVSILKIFPTRAITRIANIKTTLNLENVDPRETIVMQDLKPMPHYWARGPQPGGVATCKVDKTSRRVKVVQWIRLKLNLI